MSYPPPQQERLLQKTLPLGFYSSGETLKMFEEDTVTESRPSSPPPPPPHPAPVIFSSAQKQGIVRRVRAGIGWHWLAGLRLSRRWSLSEEVWDAAFLTDLVFLICQGLRGEKLLSHDSTLSRTQTRPAGGG